MTENVQSEFLAGEMLRFFRSFAYRQTSDPRSVDADDWYKIHRIALALTTTDPTDPNFPTLKQAEAWIEDLRRSLL